MDRRESRVSAIVLAAGRGRRMNSVLPKVLHRVAGRPILALVLDAIEPLDVERTVVVVPPDRREMEAALNEAGFAELHYVVQQEPLGTADAARLGLAGVGGEGSVLVVPGDHPVLQSETLQRLLDVQRSAGAGAVLLTVRGEDPMGRGRVVRGAGGDVVRVVEQADATDAERAITEYNAGIYAFDAAKLSRAVDKIDRENAQGEYYLTDVVEVLSQQGELVLAHSADRDDPSVLGVNSRIHLAETSRLVRQSVCERWLEAGVDIVDPSTTYIDAAVTIERGALIHPFTFLEGATTIGERAQIGPQARIVSSSIAEAATVTSAVVRGSQIARGASVGPFAVVLDSEIGPGASVGPFASLRPGSKLEARAYVGTFVEMKKTRMGEGSKAPHLTYLGDAEIGAGVNIGAGTITCNWDGREKHETVIEDDAYISSDTMLVAPVRVGKRAATGAGAVVKDDVPDDALAVGVPARVIEGKGNKMGKPVQAGSEGAGEAAATSDDREKPEDEASGSIR